MQAVGQLAGGIAHDFNNLLTAMIGFCDLLLLRHKAGDPSFNDIMQIKQNSNRAANLVRQLLAFSRQQQLNPKVIDVTEILTELSHLIRRLIGVQIELDLVYASDLFDVKVDEGQFEQVLINLAVNARDAMDGRGNLEIKTENLSLDKPRQMMNDVMPHGDWVAIHVKDTGSGIAPDTLERIFEPFFTTKKIGEGTGLGLATVYGIVRQTGGYINVQSIEGEGTIFSVYLPRHSENKQPVAVTKDIKTEAIQQDLTGTATILLVEDEDAVRVFSARALSNKGYQVLEANNGLTALDVMAERGDNIDLIVTDVIMPEMDGPTFVKEVVKTRPDLPVIFVSGYTEDRFKEEIGDNAYFLPKPFTLQQLAVKVKDVLK
jgi:two-component system cell cycle sensor histidine kinase/response regulator CckA